MSNWIDTLADFSAAIRTGADMPHYALAATRYPAERGIEVYRNNYRGNLHDALAGTYPVIRELVGEEFFRLLAKKYIEGHPSRSGNLHHYGDRLAEFLTGFEPARELAYLPDMARLEWAYHRAYLADDAEAFDFNRLATVAPDAYALLRWKMHPSCALFVTEHPVASIWQAHQQGEQGDFKIDMRRGKDWLLVFRNGLSSEIVSIEPASYHWLEQLQQGTPMWEASEATQAVHNYFDLLTTLRHWVAQGVLVDFYISQVEQP